MTKLTPLTGAEWFAQLNEGDKIFLSPLPDAWPSEVMRIDRDARTLLVAPLGVTPGTHGMPMEFPAEYFDGLALANRVQR